MNKNIRFGIVLIITLFLIAVVILPSPGKPRLVASTNIEQAIHVANIARADGYLPGEFAVEGHVILGVEKKKNITTVYTVSSWGWYGFENRIFEAVSGASGAATVITFSQDGKGEYVLLEYKESQKTDRSGASIRKMFPSKYVNDARHADKFNDELERQWQNQAKKYLKSISREASLGTSYVEKELPTIDAEASNELLEIISRDARMNNFPYWLGTIERLEHGTRYVYETSQSKTNDGDDLMIYTKSEANGKVVAEYHYKIVGSKISLQ